MIAENKVLVTIRVPMYNQKTGEKYDLEKLIIESEIKNGTVLILI